MSEIAAIKKRVEEFEEFGGGWQITVTNPYVSSSVTMQEMGAYPEKVMKEFIGNAHGDIRCLLSVINGLEGKLKAVALILEVELKALRE